MGWTYTVRAWARIRTADAIHRGTDRLRTAAAIGPDCERGRRFRAFGAASCISYPYASIYGEAHIEIGSGTMIGAYNTIAAGFAPDQNLGDRCIIRIGDRVVLGRGSHIVGHEHIEIGDDVYTGPYVYITDQNHTYRDPDLPIGRQWPTEAPVSIGAGSWLGTNVVVLPGANIGRNVVVAAGSIVRGEIPDRCVVAGSPAKVIRRFDEVEGWVPPLRSSVGVEDIDLNELVGVAEALGVRRDPQGRF